MKRAPKPLAQGSRVAVVAPSSPAPAAELERGTETLREFGFEPIIMPSCHDHAQHRGYLAGKSDETKLRDIHRAFGDASIEGIICMRGGSGAGRLITRIDTGLIASNPKIFAGYSDITILHALIGERAGLITFHGPMATSANLHASEDPGDKSASREAFLRALTDPSPLGPIRGRAISPGYARGELVGGNLAVLCTTVGTIAQPDTRGKILLIEDVDEKPYSVDRMLVHLINAGMLAEIAGVAIGEFNNCDPPAEDSFAARRTVDDVLTELLTPLGVPILGGLPVGHGAVNITLPLGAEAEIDAGAETLSFPKPALAM